MRDAVTVGGVRQHQAAFQEIADDNDGTRVSGTSGYDKSADYVEGLLKATGYYDVTRQVFDYKFFELISAAFSQTSPEERDFEPFDFSANTGDFDVMDYSGGGTVDDVAVAAVNDLIIPFPPNANTSNSGCEAEDFEDGDGNSLVDGKVALIQRGTCNFSVKAENAENAGAVAALIFNEGQPDEDRAGVVLGTLGADSDIGIPVIGISYALGVELAQAQDARVSISVEVVNEIRTTSNVLAQTKTGRDDRVVVVGAHLDSVPEGPGINDNGSGSAVTLEIALQMAALGIEPTNQVRFAWWGAEEAGLVGAEYYVGQLGKKEIQDIAVNLNFDMVGSPNYVPFVYDGDGSDTPVAGPNGSKNVEAIFLEYFDGQDLETEPTAFDGRSDYGPFIAVGVPAGGLFTGAEGIKTPEQAATYGGTAGVAYDPCYHQACDTFENNSDEALDQMSNAAAHAVLTFAMTKSAVNGTGKVSTVARDALERRGPYYQK